MFLKISEQPEKLPEKKDIPDFRFITNFCRFPAKIGREKIFKTPDELWIKSCEYFEWVKDNPLYEQRVFLTKTGIRKTFVNKRRAMTIKGLCVHLEMTNRTFDNYRKRDEFKWVTEMIVNIIYTQKFEGAAAGLLNANLIARELGLADKQVIDAGVTVTKKNFNDFYNENKE